MKSLLRFLIRYHVLMLFIILEVIAFILIGNFNSFQRAKIYNLRHSIIGGLTRRYNHYTDYLTLTKENKALTEENLKLYNLLPDSYFNPLVTYIADSSGRKQYTFIASARVINNSTNKQYNFITINRGRLAGIEPEMAVICDQGIVGVVKEVTDNYSTVISVLNREFFPSAKIKKNEYFGPLEWPGIRYDEIYLKEIPLHVDIKIGDTIVSNEFISVFPGGIMVGTVKDFKPEEGLFLRITVKLSTDFKKLTNVVVVKNIARKEKLKIETETYHD
jgi:rod shape-determining protein MreC